MSHILVAGKLHPAGLDFLRGAAGVTFDYVEAISEPSYAPLIGKADGLLIRTQPLAAALVSERRRGWMCSTMSRLWPAPRCSALIK